MITQSFLAMTPAQYHTLTGSSSPCNVSEGLICLDRGSGTGKDQIKLHALMRSLESAQQLATICNNKLVANNQMF